MSLKIFSTIASDIVAKLEALVGADKLSADAIKDGATNKAYTAVEQNKLSGIAENADVTTPASIIAAGAYVIGTNTMDDITNGATNKLYSATEKAKLAGIEEGADVTDATNVDAAGATMNTDLVTVATASSPIKTLASGLIDPTFVGGNYSKEPTGFADTTSSTPTWSDSSPDRTFTITGSNFVIFSAGYKVLKSTESIQIENIVGTHWIYYNNDASHTLTESVNVPDFNSGCVLIATVYWNGTVGAPGDERHGIVMDGRTHELIHKTIGARFESGFVGTFADASMSITRGYFWDEDIRHDSGGTITTCKVFYRDGSTWKWISGNATVHYVADGNVKYDNAGVLTSASSNNYVAYWVFATNSADARIISIMGQRQDKTLANARANNTYESLSFGILPFAEMKLLYRVIVRNDATPYEETQDYRSVGNISSGTYVATAHSALSGLTADDHLQYLLRSDANITNGRLCLATGAPDTINQTASATLYFTPYLGNAISLLISGTNSVKTFTEQTIDISALTADKNYDIFAYWDSTTSTVKIEALVWTNDTTRATALVLTGGVYYKNGDTTRKYIGTIRTISSTGTKCVDSEYYRYVDNAYNKITKCLRAYNEAWTYNTNAYREWNNGTNMIRGNFIAGIAKNFKASMSIPVRSLGGVDDLYFLVGIGINSTTSPTAETETLNPKMVSASAHANALSVVGFNYITGIEKAALGTGEMAGPIAHIVAEINC